MVTELRRGQVVWANFDPAVGREQGGHRPAVVVASIDYLETATTLAIVVPATTADRGWPNHIRLAGPELELSRTCFAMTEQPKTIDRRRIKSIAGVVDAATLAEIDVWLRSFLDLPRAS